MSGPGRAPPAYRLPGGLRLAASSSLLHRLEGWIDRHALAEADPPGGTGAQLTLEAAPAEAGAGARSDRGTPTLRLGSAEAWIEGGVARLRDGRSGAGGTLVLEEARGGLTVPEGDAPIDDLLTVAVALLLGRTGRALVHAGAIVDPRDGGWLVAGDARTGKSTVCATLARGGWGLMSDDQAVLAPGAPGPTVEGWPRPLRLDTGWPEGAPTGRRHRRTPAEVDLTRRRGPASVVGVLLPRVRVGEPTRAERATAGDALVALVRQSPWLMADRRGAAGLLELLERVVDRPAWRLRLGRDAFGDPGPIGRALSEAGA